MSPVGIRSYGTYLPGWRIDRAAIGSALGTPAGRGTRSVSSYDEDTTSMAVEAGRRTLLAVDGGGDPGTLLFSTTTPAYALKTNATAIHAALALAPGVLTYDMVGSVRSSHGALRAGLDAAAAGRSALVLASDVRVGLPGSAEERDGGDAACGLLLDLGDDLLADIIGTGSSTAELLDRWSTPGAERSREWEERFAETTFHHAAAAAAAAACAEAGVQPAEVDHLVVCGTHGRAIRRFAAGSGVRPEAIADDLGSRVGNPGAAQATLLLASVLERSRPGEVILHVTIAEGAEALVLRVGEAVVAFRPTHTIDEQLQLARTDLAYLTYATWRGVLRREPPRRPEPAPPAAPPALRSAAWKYAFQASVCRACKARHLPPARVCARCRAVDDMTVERLADVPGTIATFTVDRLAYSLSPPAVVAIVDFDGGGRFQCELTDVDPDRVAIGDRVELTFRRLFTADGIHNYFWKAKPHVESALSTEAKEAS